MGDCLTISRADIQRHLDPHKAQEMDNQGLKPTLCLSSHLTINLISTEEEAVSSCALLFF